MSTQRLLENLGQLPGLAEENVVIFDGFADNLAKKNDSLIHYLLSNPAYDLINCLCKGAFFAKHLLIFRGFRV